MSVAVFGDYEDLDYYGDGEYNDSDATAELEPPPSTEFTTMLANAMNLVQDNEVLRNLIADAIASASD